MPSIKSHLFPRHCNDIHGATTLSLSACCSRFGSLGPFHRAPWSLQLFGERFLSRQFFRPRVGPGAGPCVWLRTRCIKHRFARGRGRNRPSLLKSQPANAGPRLCASPLNLHCGCLALGTRSFFPSFLFFL